MHKIWELKLGDTVLLASSQTAWVVKFISRNYITLINEANRDYRIIEISTQMIAKHDRVVNLYELFSESNDLELMHYDLESGNIGLHMHKTSVYIQKIL